MGTLTALLSWAFFHTIYGIIGLTALVYVLLRELRKRLPKLPEPMYIAGPVFLIGLVVLPSIPRYKFERDALANIEGKDWMRVVSQARVGDVLEPLTWVKTPVGSITVVMPEPPVEGAFRQITLAYEQEPIISTVGVDCADSTIYYARPDKAGVFRYTTPYPVKMNPQQRAWYCEHDWAREKEAFRTEYLRQAGEQGKRQ